MYKIAPKTRWPASPMTTASASAPRWPRPMRCARARARLTELRRRVLEPIPAEPQAAGAYDILAVLNETDGRRAAPPTVHRAGLPPGENGLVP